MLLLLAVLACKPEPVDNPVTPDPMEVSIGEPLPLWQEGYLDIHSIETPYSHRHGT